jgi:hypothetical protein
MYRLILIIDLEMQLEIELIVIEVMHCRYKSMFVFKVSFEYS